MLLMLYLAQATPPVGTGMADWVNVALNAGTGIFVLLWFMYRMTPAINDLSKSMDRTNRILVTLTLAVAQELAHCAAIKEQCEGYKKELDEAEAARNKP